MKDMDIIADENFFTFMNEKVVPYLESICQSGYVEAARPSKISPAGGKLYYEMYRPKNAVESCTNCNCKGTIVICHGFSESIEKYKEVIYYFTTAGYQVYLADHRGHGRSLRDTSHPHMVHVRQFADYVEDLHSFILKVVKPSCGELPLYLYAHSMGGCIGAMYLETYPDTFQKAILTSPMLGIMLAVPAPCALALGHIMTSLHKEESYAPGQSPYSPDEKFEDSCSSSLPRFQYYQEKRAANPLFQTSGASYGWSYQSLHACRFATQKRNCEKITVPVLVFQSLNDNLVKASSIQRFVERTPSASLIKIDGSRHEIYNSPAKVLKEYYRAVFEFLKE
ncbi:MAG: alpha/beta hydrolase [Clostridium sp.]|nr:alpha/beta hydrolase [Clostridium sp.]